MSKDTWEKFYRSRGRYYLLPHQNINKVVSKFQTYKIKKVLDLGCGSGRHTIFLSKTDFSLTGIDFSKKAISLAKKWAKKEKVKPKFIIANIHKKLKLKNNSFDAIIAIDSLHYESSEDLKTTLKECKRVLKNDGLIFITLPTQICNPLVTHLIFTKAEIKDLISAQFSILESFLDKNNFLCTFAINDKNHD